MKIAILPLRKGARVTVYIEVSVVVVTMETFLSLVMSNMVDKSLGKFRD